MRKIWLQLFGGDGDAGQGQEPAGAAGAQDQPAGGEDGGQGGAEPQAGTADLDALRQELERARKEAAKYRTERKQWQDQLQQLRDTVAKALGIKSEDQLDAERLSRELEQLRSRYRQERLRGAFFRLAGELGADAELAYAYLAAAGDLDDLDVDAEDFQELLKQRIQSALAAKPKLRSDPPAPAKSGGDFGGGGSQDGLLTLEQIKAMTPEQINANWERVAKSLQALRR